MIVKLHGTSGSGKTTAVREFMDLAEGVVPIHVEPYKKPEAYKIAVGTGFDEELFTVQPGAILLDSESAADNEADAALNATIDTNEGL